MAARQVFKLFHKTCSFTLNSTCPTNISPATEKTSQRQPRSCSQASSRQGKEYFYQARNISKSLDNFKEYRYKNEDNAELEEERNTTRRDTFPATVDVSMRDPAREFKEKAPPEEITEDGNTIYELAEGARSEQNYFDVFNYLKKKENDNVSRMFLHLQPSNVKPFGSNENLHSLSYRKKKRIVYPVVHTTTQSDSKKKRIDDSQRKEFSSYRPHKEYPGYEEMKKFAVCEESQKMKYSTLSARNHFRGKPTLTLSKSFTSTALLKKKGTKKKEEILEARTVSAPPEKTFSHYRVENTGSKGNLIRTVSSKQLLLERITAGTSTRKYNTQGPKESKATKCDDYVTVKLGDLEEECRREKRCKPKKISFGRLPKMSTPDCPCIEDFPLKEGKPILRLKKRFDIKDRDNTCPPENKCPTPRADANLKIKKKTLPVIEVRDCPCEEREMTDLVIKRLPKKKVPEPERVCPCEEPSCFCPPRADDKIVVEKKSLPKFEPVDCPCVEDIPFKDVPLKKLAKKKVKEPKRVCKKVRKCDPVTRSDHGLKVEKKALPELKGECACVVPPPMEEGTPIKRLKKVKYVEKPRVCIERNICEENERADQDLKMQKKTLPVFVPQDCPCIEPEPPSDLVKLKRLPKKKIPEKKKICVKEAECPPRADDGLKIKPKQLPILEPKECPCVEVEMKDFPPLKKLVAKPVEEPRRVCIVCDVCDTTRRSDENLRIKPKKLPPLPPGDCPCIPPAPPLQVRPLRKLKKKPVTFVRVCPPEVEECPVRADDSLKVQAKKLPKLEIDDCPCKELEPPDDVKPLRRLKKVHVPEPPRICPKIDICDEIPRADADDWLYWKKAESKPAECESVKTSKRAFSTFGKRYYSTSIRPENDPLVQSFEVPRLPSKSLKEEAYNIVIDIKPSAPLILTQKPLELAERDSLGSTLYGKNLKKLEPVDGVTFVIYKNNSLGNTKKTKEGSSDGSSVRFISTSSTLCENSDKDKDKKDHQTTFCECTKKNVDHLQPNLPFIAEKETFIKQYPSDELIETSAKKSRLYSRKRKEDAVKKDEECKKEEAAAAEAATGVVICDEEEMEKKKLSLWERVVNYFKARPCPPPEEFKKMRLKEEAERAASKAGMCLYDPKEMLKKNEKDLPKVITADSCKEELSK